MVGFLIFMVLLTVAISIFRPEALKGERYIKASTVDEESLNLKIKDLTDLLSKEKNKNQALESQIQELKTQKTPEQLENLKYQIIDHCSPYHETSFAKLCASLGIKDETSTEALEVKSITGRMREDGEMNERYILKN
jgi:hypothetical protein